MLGQNIVFEKFSRGCIRRMVNIPVVRYVDMTVTTERDKICRVSDSRESISYNYSGEVKSDVSPRT